MGSSCVHRPTKDAKASLLLFELSSRFRLLLEHDLFRYTLFGIMLERQPVAANNGRPIPRDGLFLAVRCR